MFKVAALCSSRSPPPTTTMPSSSAPIRGSRGMRPSSAAAAGAAGYRRQTAAAAGAGAGGLPGGMKRHFEEGFHQIQHLVDPAIAARRHCFVVPNQLPLLPVRGAYHSVGAGRHALRQPYCARRTAGHGQHRQQQQDNQRVLSVTKLTQNPAATTYVATLERPFLSETRAYYAARSAEWLAERDMTFARYVQVCQCRTFVVSFALG